jgi:hypothetical protein
MSGMSLHVFVVTCFLQRLATAGSGSDAEGEAVRTAIRHPWARARGNADPRDRHADVTKLAV